MTKGNANGKTSIIRFQFGAIAVLRKHLLKMMVRDENDPQIGSIDLGSSETVQSLALSLQGIHHIIGSDGLTTSMLSVGQSILDHVLEEHLQHSSGFFVDAGADTLHTSSASQTANGGLGDTLNVVVEHTSVTLGADLAQSFSSFASSRHVCLLWLLWLLLDSKFTALLYSLCHLASKSISSTDFFGTK